MLIFGWVIFNIGVLANTHILLKQYLLIFIISVVLTMLLKSAITDIVSLVVLGGKMPYVKLVFSLLFFIGLVVISFLFIKALSNLTNENMFLWAWIIGILGSILMLVGFIQILSDKKVLMEVVMRGNTPITLDIGEWLIYGASALHIWAWLKFREIRQP